jgi:ABC-type sugar transport system substrate-binding protein
MGDAMKKQRYRNFQFTKFILAILLIALVGYIGFITDQIRSSEMGSGNLFKRIPEQQYVIITDDEESYVHVTFMEGVKAASESLNVVVKIESIKDSTNEDEIEDAFKASMYAHVDGIILKLASNDRAEAYIKQSEAWGIPVVAVGNDSITSERSAYIGTNKYKLGLSVGELILSDEEAENVLIIFDFNYNDKKGAATNNYLNGLLSVMNEIEGRSIQTLFLEEDQRIESMIKSVLDQNKPDYIIATDPINSLRVTKTLIDLNEIGNVKIIASSEHPDVVNYLKKGTIVASAVEDYQLIGNGAIQTIYELGHQRSASAYLAISFEIIGQETVGERDDLE